MKMGFLGCGKMAGALAAGMTQSGFHNPEDVVVYDIREENARKLADSLGVRVAETPAEVAAADAVMLCVKPDDVAGCLATVADTMANRLLVSIAAGVRLEQLAAKLPIACRIARVMPNTPALIGQGAAAFSMSDNATEEDRNTVHTIFEAVGTAVEVRESQMDAVTGLSGSGPAYVYLAIEALADGGVAAGLPRDTAMRLAAQTVAGAAGMVLQTGMHPGELKDMVASPGGTTIAGLATLEASSFRSSLIEAVLTGADRSKELGEENGS